MAPSTTATTDAAPSVTRCMALIADKSAEAAYRDSTRATERASMRVGAWVVIAADMIALGASVLVDGRPLTVSRGVAHATVLAGCVALWLTVGHVSTRRWRTKMLISGLVLIAAVNITVLFGDDVTFRGALLIPAGVLVIYVVVRLDLPTLMVFATAYASSLLVAWHRLSVHAPRTQLLFLILITALAYAVGLIESRRAQRERRIVYLQNRALLTQQESLKALSTTDDLTGLDNRRSFYTRADACLAGHGARPGSVAFLLIDLDRFKEINDTLGHAAGDELLKIVADRLGQALPHAVSLARLGGDEFVAVTVRSEQADDGWPPAEAQCVADALGRPAGLAGLTLTIRASVGLAIFDGTQDRAELLRQADVAMYVAKRRGGGVHAYHPGKDGVATRATIALAGELAAAIGTAQLCLYYQPKTAIVSGATCAVEALIRWQHPTRGLLAPGDFLPVAESNGLMRDVTLHVIKTALAQFREWQSVGLDIRIAVNLSPVNLLDTRFPADVKHLLETAGVSAQALQLEITENTIMTDPDRILATITALGDLGFTFALDDYGTGYSSLSYLSLLPVDEIKIDRSFIADLPTNPRNRVIVRSTIEMAHHLGFTVVAEGIEDAETWRHLTDLRCDTGQGYYLSRPKPAPDVADWIRASAVNRRPAPGSPVTR